MGVKVEEAAAEGAAWPRTATIGDSLRASIVSADAEGLLTAWDKVCTSKQWRVVRLKNKFLEATEEMAGRGSGNNALASPNLHVNVIFGEDGPMPIVAEIQIHYQPVIELKKCSHKLYQVTRANAAEDARA